MADWCSERRQFIVAGLHSKRAMSLYSPDTPFDDGDVKNAARILDEGTEARQSLPSAERVKIVLPVTSKFDYDNQRERYYDANGQELWPDDLIEALNAAPSAPSSAADTMSGERGILVRDLLAFAAHFGQYHETAKAATAMRQAAEALQSATRHTGWEPFDDYMPPEGCTLIKADKLALPIVLQAADGSWWIRDPLPNPTDSRNNNQEKQ